MNYVILAIALFLAGCGSQDHAGGSGMEIPNSINMVALQSDGTPVKFGRVRIVTDSKWMVYVNSGESIVLDSMITDNNGQFLFSPPDLNRVRIEIISNGEGSSVLFDSTSTTIMLETLGSVQAQWIPGATVMIAGTSFSQIVDQNGIVYFASIPSINSVLIGIEDDQKPVILASMDLKPNETLQLGELQFENESLQVDDFENMRGATLLDPFVHGSYWFSIADENEGGSSTIYPSTANGDSWSLAISDSLALNGNSLFIRYQLKVAPSINTYALFGCTLGDGINASAIDSLTFLAHSNGSFVLTNGTKTLLRGIATTTTEWERFVVYRSELDSLGVISALHLLQFEFNDTTGSEFRLDDLVIYGDPFELLQVE